VKLNRLLYVLPCDSVKRCSEAVSMRRLVIAILLSSLGCAAQTAPPPQDSQGRPQAGSATSKSRIVVPAGTTVALALTRPVLTKTANPGDSIYAETVFPVAVNNQMAIPPGTYVEGRIDTLTRPGWLSPHAHFQIHFTKMIFAAGYTIQLPNSQSMANVQPPAPTASAVTGKHNARAEDVIAAVADTFVDVSSASDVLLDNGSQIEMILQLPLRLNAASVADSVRRSYPAPIPQFKSATQCRPTPGTPGTSDTVIHGIPGSSGTPDIVIPGAPGMPDTVIPGIPATQGTPDTVIPGTPGTPGTSCPGPPVVTSNPKAQKYKESFQIAAPVQVSGKQLTAGTYQVTWAGSGPSVLVNFLQNGKTVVSSQAKVLLLNMKSPANKPATRANPDGSASLRSLRFAGQTFALYFAPGAS
jgi:hypothetical protein